MAQKISKPTQIAVAIFNMKYGEVLELGREMQRHQKIYSSDSIARMLYDWAAERKRKAKK